jgi:hypothetical protein
VTWMPRQAPPCLPTAIRTFGITLLLSAASTTVLTAAISLTLTGIAAYAFVTMTSTTLQLHSSAAYRAHVLALFTFLYLEPRQSAVWCRGGWAMWGRVAPFFSWTRSPASWTPPALPAYTLHRIPTCSLKTCRRATRPPVHASGALSTKWLAG